MTRIRKICMSRGILLVSALCCLLMVTTARPLPVLQWGTFAVLISAGVWKGTTALAQWDQEMSKARFWILGCFLSFTLGYVFFYSTWAYSELFENLGVMIGLSARWIALAAAGGLIVASIPAIVYVCAVLGSSGRKAIEELSFDSGKIPAKHALWLLSAAYAFGMTAILRANFYYIDDLGRAAYGYKEWQFFSRFLSAAFSTYLHGDSYLTDVSPLPQLAAAAILAAASVLVLSAVLDRKSFSVWELIAVIPLGLNPYFLECLSYKYDAPYMALSILAAVFPMLYWKSARPFYILAAVLGTLGVCTTYQAASGIFPMLVVLIAVRAWAKEESWKKTLCFCLESAGSYGIGLVLFQQLILRPEKTYAGTLATTGSLIPTLVGNYRKFYGLVWTDWKGFWILQLGILAVGFLMGLAENARRKKWAVTLVGCFALVCMVLLCFGVYPALAAASFDPRAMYGFGVMAALFAVCAAEGQGMSVSKLCAVVLSWAFLVFAFTYGNALYVQRQYTDFRIQMVIEDINDLDLNQREEPVRVEVTGTIGQSPILRNMPQNYQMLNRLVPNNFNGDWMWGVYGLHNYYDLKNTVWVEEMLTDRKELHLIQDGMYHTIWGNDECIQIELK